MLSSSGIRLTPEMLAPVTTRDIIERMWRNLRITSYNVCYTKLLRYVLNPDTLRSRDSLRTIADSLDRERRKAEGLDEQEMSTEDKMAEMFRKRRPHGRVITSYSIHYTKLYENIRRRCESPPRRIPGRKKSAARQFDTSPASCIFV